MANRMIESALVLGLVSALALSTAAPSFGQTQRQRPSAQEQGLGASPPAAGGAARTIPQSGGRSAVRFVLDPHQRGLWRRLLGPVLQ